MNLDRQDRWLNALVLLAASGVGVAAFLYPFAVRPDQPDDAAYTIMAHAQEAPLIFALLIFICLGTVVANLSRGALNSKIIAVLGILVAIAAVLRAVPGPAGFNAIYLLPIVAGYVYGATFGFLLGALSLLVSALIGAQVGPWLPFQMFAMGWVGVLAGAIPQAWLRPHPRWEVMVLAAWGGVLGFLYGVIMNLWFWPFALNPGQSDLYWEPGIGWIETLRRYALFYLLTSLGWDLARAVGNILLIAVFGMPVLRLLRRFQRRFLFYTVPITGGGVAGYKPARKMI